MTAATVTTRQVLVEGAVGHVNTLPEAQAAARLFSFGPFQLFPSRRLLLRDGQPVQLGSRSLDILIALAERRGDVVDKNELIARVWPGITVDEGSLRVHIAGLRKAFGEGGENASYVKTVTGRGYCLAATSGRPELSGETGRQAEIRVGHTPRLPMQLSQMIGGGEAVRKISDLLAANRFVTIHGPGGAGKTTTAVAAGHSQLALFEGAVHFVDLGQIKESSLLPGAIASIFGLSIQSGDPTRALLDLLRDRRMLVIFDSCEHLIEPAAALIERLFHAAPQVHILATSREILRVDGEHVFRFSGLDCPSDEEEQSTERIFSFDAPRLFTERAITSGYRFPLNDANAPVVARICRKLDGLPLAIDIAAARVPAFGLSEVARSLETGIWLFWRGQRTAQPRHQTISATIDWSYDLLGDDERAVLQQLSARDGFSSLDTVCEIARQALREPSREFHVIDKLVAKSLISFEVDESGARYRLLNSTRAYAREKVRDRNPERQSPPPSLSASSAIG